MTEQALKRIEEKHRPTTLARRFYTDVEYVTGCKVCRGNHPLRRGEAGAGAEHGARSPARQCWAYRLRLRPMRW